MLSAYLLLLALVGKLSLRNGTKYSCVALAVTGSSVSQYGCACCCPSICSPYIFWRFSFDQQAAGARDTVSKVRRICSPSRLVPTLILFLDLRDMDTYLGTLHDCLSVPPSTAHSTRRSSSRVDMTTVTFMPPALFAPH